MRRTIALALLSLATAACEPSRRPGYVPVCEIEDGYQRGDVELIVDPSASFGDDGAAYAPTLAGRYVVAAIDLRGPAGTDPPLYIYSSHFDAFWYLTTLRGYQVGQSQMEPYAGTITRGADRLYPLTPGAAAPNPDHRRMRRLTDKARRIFNADPVPVALGASVALLLILALLFALVGAITETVIGAIAPLVTTLSDIAARHRVISHAERVLRQRSTPKEEAP